MNQEVTTFIPNIRLSRQSAKHVATRVVALRTERDWTTGRLARELGVRWSSLKKIETAASLPSLGMLIALVRVFELSSVEEVLGEGRLGTSLLLALEVEARRDAHIRLDSIVTD